MYDTIGCIEPKMASSQCVAFFDIFYIANERVPSLTIPSLGPNGDRSMLSCKVYLSIS